MQDKVTIKIPRDLYRRLSQMIAGTGFSSVNEFIVFVMRTLASSGEIKDDEEEDRVAFSKEEEEEVKKRLRALGYLD